MATYKVLQDIEAEDKFFGPLTLKQCIFGAVAVVGAYLTFLLISKGIWVMAIPLLPVIVVTGFLAFPWGRDQPTEVWLLAKIRFFFKPRKRIWDQSGIQELVKITAPPPAFQFEGDNLSQIEVKSRLKALAETIDTRGWAVKNSSIQPALAAVTSSTDRLVDSSSLPAVISGLTDDGASDMFDKSLSSKIDSQITASAQNHKVQIVEKIKDTLDPNVPDTPTNNFWFMNQPNVVSPGMASFGTQSSAQVTEDNLLPDMFSDPSKSIDPTDLAFVEQNKRKKQVESQSFRNHRTIDPGGPKTASPTVTAPYNPATIVRARNDDRTVESLQREADQDDEVVISLH